MDELTKTRDNFLKEHGFPAHSPKNWGHSMWHSSGTDKLSEQQQWIFKTKLKKNTRRRILQSGKKQILRRRPLNQRRKQTVSLSPRKIILNRRRQTVSLSPRKRILNRRRRSVSPHSITNPRIVRRRNRQIHARSRSSAGRF